MFLNRFYKEINFPLPFNFVLPEDESNKCAGGFAVEYDFEKNLSSEYKNWLALRGMHIGHAEIFNIGPNMQFDHVPIHSDSSTIDNHVKINYTICRSSVRINWYKSIDEKYLKNPSSTTAMVIDKNKCNKIHTEYLDRPNGQCYLFNAGQLHSLDKVDSLCTTFCLVPKDKNGIGIQWDDAIKLFNF